MRNYFSFEYSKTLHHILVRHNNNFDVVRLIAALMVIYGHAFILFPTNGHEDFLRQLLKVDYSGSIAVCIFFFLSGIFVTQSLEHSKSLKNYCITRFFRIWPGLAACILLTVFLIAPFFKTATPFFFTIGTVNYFINLSLIVSKGTLPGMFLSNHYPNAVNGSLWTLPVEVRCYFSVALLWLTGIVKRPWILIALLGLILFFPTNIFINAFLWHLFSIEAVKCYCFFLIGIISYCYRKKLVVNGIFCLLMIIITALLFKTPLFIYAFYFSLCYFLLWFGSRKSIIKFHLPGDYSYGIYLYGFLIQQVVASMFSSTSSYDSLGIVYPIVFLLAFLSWNFVEKPFILFGKKITTKK